MDLFAGLGGFSQGAILAGADVVEVYDCDPVPLKLLGANIPGVKVHLATLGPKAEAVELPPAAPDLHVHASTPCTELSPAKYNATENDIEAGVGMLGWALDLILERGDHSWSLENVSTPVTRKLLADYKSRCPVKVDFASLDAADFGAPQTRTRLIAGPPQLIKLLQQMPSARRVSVREAFAAHGAEPASEAFKNQTRNRDGTPCVRTIEELSFTVCASHPLTWASRDGKTVRVMNTKESAILMGFTHSWRLPCVSVHERSTFLCYTRLPTRLWSVVFPLRTGSRTGQRAVGNALCVAMSEAIVQCAISIHTGVPVPIPTPTQPQEPNILQDELVSEVPPARSSRKLQRRLKSIEVLLRGLYDQAHA